jgi:hypothetical protein
MFYIVDSHGFPRDEPYITLSHRWAQTEHILLTTETQQQLQDGLPINRLPKTFQDTIVVSQHLGVRYLWIDCLCIIQAGDGGNDWKLEAMGMADVYKGAYMNVSADEASDTHGLFFERDLEIYIQARIRLQVKGVTSVSDWSLIDKGMWITQVNRSPLSERGWVFQERILASRVAHFCRQEIFWECRESSLCESFPSKLPPSELFDLGEAVSLRRFELWQDNRGFPLGSTPHEVWDDIVKAYSKCQLSYPTGRLVALAGVARHMKSVIKDTYVAGMWLKYMAAELAWWVEPRRERYTLGREPPYYAPSFYCVKGQINSAGPFAPGILVDLACVPLTAGVSGQEVFNEDVFGLSRRPCFRLKVTGDLKATRLRKIEGEWCMTPRFIYRTDGEEETDDSFFLVFAYLDVDIEVSAQAAFEEETFYFMP